MTTEDRIIQIVCLVDDQMQEGSKHPQAKQYPSELVTIGLLFALKGGHFRAFSRWLKRDDDALFAGLPDRTRLQRLLVTHQDGNERFLADPSVFLVIDRFPIELLFPIRQGRSPRQFGRKSKDKGRWSIGIKLCWVLNRCGQVVDWDWDTMNVPDNEFHALIQQFRGRSIILADYGFRRKDSVPENGKRCAKGTWNDRMTVETSFSLLPVICGLKRMYHRLEAFMQAHLASAVALFPVLLTLFHQLHPDADPLRMSIAAFRLSTSTIG